MWWYCLIKAIIVIVFKLRISCSLDDPVSHIVYTPIFRGPLITPHSTWFASPLSSSLFPWQEVSENINYSWISYFKNKKEYFFLSVHQANLKGLNPLGLIREAGWPPYTKQLWETPTSQPLPITPAHSLHCARPLEHLRSVAFDNQDWGWAQKPGSRPQPWWQNLCTGVHNDHLDRGAYISTPIVQNCTQTLSTVHLHLKPQK